MAWVPGDGERLRQALAYAARGIPVLPLHHPVVRQAPGGTVTTSCSCPNPACQAVGKHPATARGAEDATTEPARLVWWWRRYPEANIGLATGWVFDVLDVDGPESGDSLRWSAVSQLLGLRGPLVRTGGDGWHFYLAPTGLRDPRVRGLAKVEWRGRGGWVVAPPSRHASGAVYAWVRDLAAPLPAVPPSLRRRLRTGPPAWGVGLDGGGEGPGRLDAPPRRYDLPLAEVEAAGLLTEEPSQTRRTLALADRLGSACPAHLPAVDGDLAVPVPPTARPDRGA